MAEDKRPDLVADLSRKLKKGHRLVSILDDPVWGLKTRI